MALNNQAPNSIFTTSHPQKATLQTTTAAAAASNNTTNNSNISKRIINNNSPTNDLPLNRVVISSFDAIAVRKELEANSNKKSNRKGKRSLDEKPLGESSERFLQESYVCPFCGQMSVKHEDQIEHLRSAHPWYNLDVHNGTI